MAENVPLFSAYEKMVETSSQWKGKEFDSVKKWVAVEKIHGANFSLTVWKTKSGRIAVKMGKRSQYLRAGENFFGLHSQTGLLNKMEEGAKRVFTVLEETEGEFTSAIIYGELFGGNNSLLFTLV